MLPSIWRGIYHCGEQWRLASSEFSEFSAIAGNIDKHLIGPGRPFVITAWCAVCRTVSPMTVRFQADDGCPDALTMSTLTETANCHGCLLWSRVRALMVLLDELELDRDAPVYVSERTTRTYQKLSERFTHLIGSEYLGPGILSGETHLWQPHQIPIRHEDMTRLSFPDASLNCVLTFDVFEHIPDYLAVFRECRRVLRPGGHLLFTIPFFADLDVTIIRAVMSLDGHIEHRLPPEYHGNPLSDQGSLCFQYFGWDILANLVSAGFSSASAHLYWGPWQGHLGLPHFVFHACG